MIEQYEKEMRRLFEEKQKFAGFEEPAVKTAVFPEDAPSVPEFQQREQENIIVPESPVPDVPQKNEAEEPQDDSYGTGTVIAEVTTARGAVPLEGVTVIIDKFGSADPMGRKELVALRTTDRSGRTAPVKVEAASKELSLEPGKNDPFSTFYVSARLKNFEPVQNRPVDVFADEVSIIKIDLVPKPENLAGGEKIQW